MKSKLLLLIISVIFLRSNLIGQNEQIYWVGQANLINATTQCNVNNYYGNNIGFQWTDNLPTGTQITAISVEYNIGVSCTNPTTITPTLNGTNQTQVTFSGECICTPSVQTYTTQNLNTANYNINANNTYLLPGTSTTGFNNQPASLQGFFAKVTVTYGADDDAGIEAINLLPSFCAQTQNISVELRNFGTNNITSAAIEWEINGTPQTTVSYSGTLAPNALTTVLLASNFNFTNGQYIITVRTNNPNNTTDSNTTNDELEQTINVGALAPTNITHTEVTPNNVYTISWVGDNTQTYDLEYGSFGFTQGTGTTISNISGTSQNISGINPDMNGYDVYVRSYCESNPSPWSSAYSFGVVPFFVSNEAELNAALTASVNDDVIVFLNDIVITSQKTISNKTITIIGEGFELSVPIPGLDEMGRYNNNPSTFRALQLSNTANVTINNLTIKGGNVSGSGGAIEIDNGTTLTLNASIVSNSRSSSGGGGIGVKGVLFMNNSFVRRNASNYGGGIIVTGSGRAYVESSTMVENRSTSSNGGGGAAECQSGSFLYFNNSTLSNNQSTEIGGAINNYQGTVYFINSSATGNVAFGGFVGGAIGNNGGNVYILNALFAHNYRRTTGTVSNPTGYILDDFTTWTSGGSGIRVYYSIYHAALPSGLTVNTGNIQYTGAVNGSDNTIFSGGLLSSITDNDGTEIGDQIYRPFLFNNQGSVAPTLQVGSFVTQSSNLGVPTRFSNNNNNNPAIAYNNGTWINLLGTSASGQEVVTDQLGNSRSTTTPTRGAIEDELNVTLYIVKVNGASGGTVSGGTIYGDVYPEGTSVTLTAIPNNGQQFMYWNYVEGGTGVASTSNPYTFTVTQDVTLVPVFQAASPGTYSITYVGNGNTGGQAPNGGTFSGPSVIEEQGNLVRTNYIFTGWNTNANGSGTDYAPGANYSAGLNLTLYARWVFAPDYIWIGAEDSIWSNANNWSSNLIPNTGDDIIFSPNAQNHLHLDQNRTIGNLDFNGSDKKIILNSFDLTMSGSVTGASTINFIQTNGTGALVTNINSSDTYTFPIGNGYYNPTTIVNNNDQSDLFSARIIDTVFLNGTSGQPFAGPRVNITWEINKANPNNSLGVDFIIYWYEEQEIGGISEFELSHHNGDFWEIAAGNQSTLTGTSIKTMTHQGYTGSFSPFAIMGNNSALPVTLMQFNANCNGDKVNISWSTASEYNASHFRVQTSRDGQSWTEVAQVEAAGTTSQTTNYFYQDIMVGGVSYYRLVQVDFNGEFEVFGPISVDCEINESSMTVYPNPTDKDFTVLIQTTETFDFATIELVDLSGRAVEVKEMNIAPGSTMIKFETDNINPGTYIVRIKGENNKFTPIRVVIL